MATYRADFEVKSTIVLPEDQESFKLTSTDPKYEMVIRNNEPDLKGYSTGLIIYVFADCESIEAVADEFTDLLMRQLDILSFTTQAEFKIEKCFRVVEWESYKRERQLIVRGKFDPLYPPLPNLLPELIQTTQAITSETPSEHVRIARSHFRNGLIAERPEEQFQAFWLAIETVAEGEKFQTPLPIPCPCCDGPLHCMKCNSSPLRIPTANQAIKGVTYPSFQRRSCKGIW